MDNRKEKYTKKHRAIFCGILLSGLCMTGNADTGSKENVVSKTADKAVFVYRPPLRGAPKTRVGAGVRGTSNSKVMLHIIAPEHTGLTLKAQPSLYWYSEKALESRLEFALIDDDSIEPVLELNLKGKARAGLNHIDLVQYNISLKTGVEYQWSVAAVYDDKNRSSDIVASGTIQRTSFEPALAKKLSEQKGIKRISLLLENGVWYDAFDELSKLVSSQKSNQAYKLARNSLLEQVGLGGVNRQLE